MLGRVDPGSGDVVGVFVVVWVGYRGLLYRVRV